MGPAAHQRYELPRRRADCAAVTRAGNWICSSEDSVQWASRIAAQRSALLQPTVSFSVAAQRMPAAQADVIMNPRPTVACIAQLRARSA